jgi:hypothetical protein
MEQIIGQMLEMTPLETRGQVPNLRLPFDPVPPNLSRSEIDVG